MQAAECMGLERSVKQTQCTLKHDVLIGSREETQLRPRAGRRSQTVTKLRFT